MTPNHGKLASKRLKRTDRIAPNPKSVDSYFLFEFELYKTIGPDKIVHQLFKTILINQKAMRASISGKRLLSSLTLTMKVKGEVREPQRIFLSGAKHRSHKNR